MIISADKRKWPLLTPSCQQTPPRPASGRLSCGYLIAGANENATPPLIVRPAPFSSRVFIVRPIDPYTLAFGASTQARLAVTSLRERPEIGTSAASAVRQDVL